MNNIYTAYDPVIKQRCLHVKVRNKFISLVTGHSFKEEMNNQKVKDMFKDEGVARIWVLCKALVDDERFGIQDILDYIDEYEKKQTEKGR